MLKGYLRSAVAPWSGLIAAPLAWLLHHQGLGDAIYFDCTTGNAANALGLGAISIFILAAAAWLSWRSRRSPDAVEVEPQARFFLSMMSVLLCALLGFAVFLQILAGLIVPACAP